MAFLAAFPPAKRQPNLLLAAVRLLAGVQGSYPAFRAVVLDRRQEMAAIMNSRSTQTNEAARCAVLLPALTRLPQPLALIEVGASAGLTLLPECTDTTMPGSASSRPSRMRRCSAAGRAARCQSRPRCPRWPGGLGST